MLGLSNRVALRGTCFLMVQCALFLGCKSDSNDRRPAIVFDTVPPAKTGGAGETDMLRGHVLNTQPDCRIVVYVSSQKIWWVQPLTNHPFTSVRSDGKWSSFTHLGAKYAALLVKPGYKPANTLAALPKMGDAVLAVETVNGAASSPKAGREIRFSGDQWKVRQVGSDRNGAPHEYDASNVEVDGKGHLHLRVTRKDDQWICSEVALPRSLGYGRYALSVEDLSQLEPAAVFDMFTWDEGGTDQDRREVDIEVTRWGQPNDRNAEYTVQPFYRPTNTYRYFAPAGMLTYTLDWEPKKAIFTTTRGIAERRHGSPVATHTFTSDVPAPKSESIRMNLCTFDYAKVPQQAEAEVVVERFAYLP